MYATVFYISRFRIYLQERPFQNKIIILPELLLSQHEHVNKKRWKFLQMILYLPVIKKIYFNYKIYDKNILN